MLKKWLLNLQLFADGGDGGGDGGSATASDGGSKVSEESGDERIPAFIPEKAKKYYQKALEKTSGSTTDDGKKTSDTAKTTTSPSTTEDLSYADLIKSDKYKDEHKAYMDKTIGDRLKKYKGMEQDNAKYKSLLDAVARNYGVDSTDDNFLEVLTEKIDANNPEIERYAMEHDVSNETAQHIFSLEGKVNRYEEEEKNRAEAEESRRRIAILHQNAEKTKAQFPDFDLDTEMQNESFRRLCAANFGDTTAAYMACHYNEIIPATVQRASRQIQAQTAQAVASNKARPIENGISSQAPSVVQQDFSKMNLQELRKFAEEEKRKLAGR